MATLAIDNCYDLFNSGHVGAYTVSPHGVTMNLKVPRLSPKSSKIASNSSQLMFMFSKTTVYPGGIMILLTSSSMVFLGEKTLA